MLMFLLLLYMLLMLIRIAVVEDDIPITNVMEQLVVSVAVDVRV